MAKLLQDSIDLINGDQKALQATALEILAELKSNDVDEQKVINGIISDAGTTLHSTTDAALNNTLTSNNGIVNQAATTYSDALSQNDNSIENIIKSQDGVNGWINNFKTQAHQDATKTVNSINAQLVASDTEINKKLEEIKVDLDAQFKELSKQYEYKPAEDEMLANVRSIADTVSKLATSEDIKNNLNEVKKYIDPNKDGSVQKVSESNAAKLIKTMTNDSSIGTKLDEIKAKIEAAKPAASQRKDAADTAQAQKEQQQAAQKASEDAARKAEADAKAAQEAAQAQALLDAVNAARAEAAARAAKEAQINQLKAQADTYKNTHIPQTRETIMQLGANEDIYKVWLQDPLAHPDAQAHYDSNHAALVAAYAALEQQVNDYNNLVAQIHALGGSYATGSKRIKNNQLAWTNEAWDAIGPEMIVRASDNAILTPLKANDAVIPANLAQNLFKWGAINPDSFAINPFMGKWGDVASGSSSADVFSNNTTTQNVEVHLDSLIRVDGNVDANVMDRLEDLAKSLTKNKDFQQNVINFVTKNYVKESRKQGFR